MAGSKPESDVEPDDKRVNIDNNPGRELTVETSSLGTYRTRHYLVGTRMYQLIIVGTKTGANGKDTERFLDSFQLNPNP